jgi:putative ABC transport system substrate-binding protein
VIVLGDVFFAQQFRQIAQLAMKHRLASTYTDAAYVESGGLLSYGPSFTRNFQNAARFVDKILKGAKAGDLPFEEPTKLDLVINRGTAKTIGLALPRELLLRADRVID